VSRRLGENILNYGLYQAGWFACVLGAAGGRPWLGMAAALLLTAVHVTLARSPGRELALVLLAGGLGAILDTLQMRLAVFAFPSGHLVGWLCPPWIVVMWMQFATLFHFALSWMGGRYALSALLGMVGKKTQTVKVEPAALKDIWIERRPFKDRLCVRPKKRDLLDAMPGDNAFELTLRIWKIYRREAQKLVEEVNRMRGA